MWLVCVPFGLIILLGYSFYAGSKRGNIEFQRNPGSSWTSFFKKVGAVKSVNGAESVLNPPFVHGLFKTILVSFYSQLSNVSAKFLILVLILIKHITLKSVCNIDSCICQSGCHWHTYHHSWSSGDDDIYKFWLQNDLRRSCDRKVQLENRQAFLVGCRQGMSKSRTRTVWYNNFQQMQDNDYDFMDIV